MTNKVYCMMNETFLVLTDEEKQSKLKTVIMSKSGNCLTDSEVQAIVLAAPLKRQYSVMIYNEADVFCGMLALADSGTTDIVLGSLVAGMRESTELLFSPERPAAFITQKEAGSCEEHHQLCIYIPQSRLQKGCAGCE